MPSAEYYRRQADLCVRLAGACSGEDSVRALLDLAEKHKAKAAELDGASLRRPAAAMIGAEAIIAVGATRLAAGGAKGE